MFDLSQHLHTVTFTHSEMLRCPLCPILQSDLTETNWVLTRRRHFVEQVGFSWCKTEESL